MQRIKDIASRISTLKTFLASLVFILPLLGTQLGALSDWGTKLYYLADHFDSFTTKKEFHTQSKEVLLYIDESLQDDISAIEWAIEDTTLLSEEDISFEDRMTELRHLKRELKRKVVAQEVIRKRIKTLDPNWKTAEEIEDEK